MSRGLGSLQRLIVATLTDAPVTSTDLCWQLAGGSRLTSAFYGAFFRALRGLEDRELVLVTRRKLKNLREFEQHYPNKTRLHELRDLRRQLLPILVHQLEQTGERRFSSTNVERHAVRLTQDAPGGERLTEAWKALEPDAYDAIGQLSNTNRQACDLAMRVLFKCRLLFDRRRMRFSEIEIGTALTDLLYRAELVPEASALTMFTRRVQEMLDEFVDLKAVHDHADLKSRLYVYAALGKDQSPGLKPEAKALLLKHLPAVVTSLPGHVPGPKLHDTTFSPLLDRLIDRHAFAQYEFLRPA